MHSGNPTHPNYLLFHQVLPEATLKKLLFPIQWVAVIVASRAAAIYLFVFFTFYFGLVGKYCPFFCKNEEKKKAPVSPFFFLLTWPLHRKQNFV